MGSIRFFDAFESGQGPPSIGKMVNCSTRGYKSLVGQSDKGYRTKQIIDLARLQHS
jgi:hypothetical protein